MRLPLSYQEQATARVQALSLAADAVKNGLGNLTDIVGEANKFYAFLSDDGVPEPLKCDAPRAGIAAGPGFLHAGARVHFVPAVQPAPNGAMIREDTMAETLRILGYSVRAPNGHLD